MSDKISGYLWGDIDLDKLIANLNLDIFKLQYKKMQLDQTLLPLFIKYDKKLQISTVNKTFFKTKDNKVILSPIQVIYDAGKFKIEELGILSFIFKETELKIKFSQT